MKKCSEIKELISLYIDDELEADERREFEEHTDSCGECRDELDELTRIIGLCRITEEEELPVDFRIELHQKLLEVQKQSKEVKPVFYNTRYFKLFSSVAAVFLLVFLIKGFYDFDLFSNGKADRSVEGINNMAAAPAKDGIQMKAALPETADGTGDSKERSGEAFQDSYNGGKGTQAGGTEADRSTAGDREPLVGLAAAETKEGVYKNSTGITIAVDDPETQIENIKAIAVKSSGMEPQAEDGAGTAYTAEADGSIVLFLNIPGTQLNAFINALNTGYGQSNVQPEAVIKEDMSAAIEDLLKQSDNLDLEIEKAENADDVDTGELDKLKGQKVEIQDRIDAIRLESDLINVKVILKKK